MNNNFAKDFAVKLKTIRPNLPLKVLGFTRPMSINSKGISASKVTKENDLIEPLFIEKSDKSKTPSFEDELTPFINVFE